MERRGDEPDRQPQEDTQPMDAPADGPDPADKGDSSQDEPEPS
jgi:hypothetical protein